jgi:hypothetical protein
MIDSTLICSGRPSSLRTCSSAVESSSCLRFLIWAQQLPRPSERAVNCTMIAAIEQSSTQTSLFVLSAQTTTAKGAFLMKSEPCCLDFERSYKRSLSSTSTNSHGLWPRDEGTRSSASTSRSTVSGATSSSVKLCRACPERSRRGRCAAGVRR